MRDDVKWGPWVGVAVIYVASACLAVPVGVVLVLGLSALGFETGWWPGDYNMNDGEGVPTTMAGLSALAVLVAGAGLGAWYCLNLVGAKQTQRWLPVTASSSLFAVSVALSFVAVFAWY